MRCWSSPVCWRVPATSAEKTVISSLAVSIASSLKRQYKVFRVNIVLRRHCLATVQVLPWGLSCQAGFYAASEKVIIHLAYPKLHFADLPRTQLIMVRH